MMRSDSNDARLTAYALGELEGSERDAVEAELRTSPAARQELEAVRELADTLREELKREPQSGLSQLQRIAIESEAQRLRRPAPRFPWIGSAIAASLVAAVGAYFYFHKERPPLVVPAPTADAPTGPEVEPAGSGRVLAKRPAPADVEPDMDAATVEQEMSGDAVASRDPSEPEPAVDDLKSTDKEAAPVVASAVAFRPNTVKFADPDDVTWIDDRIKQLWAENGIKPSGAASDGEFIRRAYLDIVGAIPPAEEAAGFIRSRDKNKKEKLIIQLLNSEAYTKYWASIWSNLLIGRQPARNVNKGSLEKYLRDCFAANKPWNQMVFELVTATGGSTVEAVKAGVPFNGATNFLLAHMNDGNVPATAFTTRLFLGVQVQCTQCHDHPFNDRTQESFWGINAFFQRMRREEHNELDDTGQRRFLFAELSEESVDADDDLFVRYDKRSALVAVTPPRLLDGRIVTGEQDAVRLREELARYIVDSQNELFTQAIVNRVWAHFLGRGIVHPADDLGTHNPASNPDLLTRLAENFRESNYDLKRLIAWITLSLPYSLSSEAIPQNKDDDQYFSHFPLKQMSPEQFFESIIVASSANRVGARGWEQADKLKEDLQSQFTTVFANDENAEADTFNGTIPQALMLMNGTLIQKAISKDKGSYLRERVDELRNRPRGADVALLNDLYLAAVSRYPTQREKTLAMALLQDTLARSKDKDPIDAYQDIFWALLNSSEFVLNH